jgi:hypothetical protein
MVLLSLETRTNFKRGFLAKSLEEKKNALQIFKTQLKETETLETIELIKDTMTCIIETELDDKTSKELNAIFQK